MIPIRSVLSSLKLTSSSPAELRWFGAHCCSLGAAPGRSAPPQAEVRHRYPVVSGTAATHNALTTGRDRIFYLLRSAVQVDSDEKCKRIVLGSAKSSDMPTSPSLRHRAVNKPPSLGRRLLPARWPDGCSLKSANWINELCVLLLLPKN
jgi:hypothetical protein